MADGEFPRRAFLRTVGAVAGGSALFGRDAVERARAGERVTATVNSVADGDTINVTLEDGTNEDVRVLGVDTPETDQQYEAIDEWEGLAEHHRLVIPTLQFEDACSLLDDGFGRLADASVVVRASPAARNENTTPGYPYASYEGAPVPLVAADPPVFGFGSLLVNDDRRAAASTGVDIGNLAGSFARNLAAPALYGAREGAGNATRRYSGRRVEGEAAYDDSNLEVGNEEFVLNVWDSQLCGSGTVLYDEGHGQPYTHENFSAFEAYAEAAGRRSSGYSLTPTGDLLADLPDADAVMITPPAEPFAPEERTALAAFAARGGAVFLHGLADGGGDDATTALQTPYNAELNALAAALGVGFRFNDDRVVDPERNGGERRAPRTSRFETRYPFFLDRSGIVDGPVQGGRPYPYLRDWADEAKDWARDRLEGETVELAFDDVEDERGYFGRLLAYVYYDPEGDGDRDALYNRRLLEEGYARVYDSSLTKHDDLLVAERDARRDGRRLWSRSDPEDSPTLRNYEYTKLLFPEAMGVRTASGPLPASRTPVFAEPSATRTGEPSVSYDDIPLVGVDRERRAAVVGGLFLDGYYDLRDGAPVNVAGMGNFPFLTRLIDALAADGRDGAVLIEGGHRQFNEYYSLSAEGARYYDRYLEGVGIDFEGVNDVANSLDDEAFPDARGLVVSTPVLAFDDDELAAVREFVDGGGAVVLLASSNAPDDELANLDAVAAGIGSDLRLTDTAVRDDRNSWGGDDRHPVTGRFNDDFDVFGPYPVEGGGAHPVVTVSGSRRFGNRLYTAGQTVRVDLAVESATHPVTVVDSVPAGWTVYDEGDVTGVEADGGRRRVALGRVSPSDTADGAVTLSYVAEAPAAETRTTHTFGPASADAGEVRGGPYGDTFAPAGDVTVVPADQNAAGTDGTAQAEPRGP